jgi:hypothetical protein
MRLTSGENEIDPLTGIPVILGKVRVTMDGKIRVQQSTGEPPKGTNQRPGTDPVAAPDDEVRLPRGFDEIPETGPLS